MLHAAKLVSSPTAEAKKADYIVSLSRAKRRVVVDGYCKIDNIPTDILRLITYFLHDNPFQYKNKPLPNHLAAQDLSGYDFTGCQFTFTDLTNTKLNNVMLANTVCDYQKAFKVHIVSSEFCIAAWYQLVLPKDLRSITEVYAKLNNNTQKKKLLQIASAFAYLPFYESKEFYIKVTYWSTQLLQLKQLLHKLYQYQLGCSLENLLHRDATEYCWTTNYPQDKVNINSPAGHAHFDIYLSAFTSGLIKYQCQSKCSCGFDWYEDRITDTIQGLQRVYLESKDKKLQQELCNIADALSKSYQIQQMTFLTHYLFYQNRLISLKKSVNIHSQNKVCYSTSLIMSVN